MNPQYDKITGALLPEGANPDYSGVKDQSLLKFSDITGQPIPVSKLGVSTPTILPEKPIVTPVTPPTLPEITTDLQKEQQKLAQEQASKETGILDLMKAAGLEQGKLAENVTQAGGDLAQQEYDRYASELAQEQRNLDIAKRDLFTKGGSVAQIQSQGNEMERTSLQKQADLAILGNAAKGRFDTAMAIAQRKVDSALAPIKAELEAKKFIYDNNKDLYTKAQLSKLDGFIKADERKLAKEDELQNQIATLSVTAAQNGATPSILGKIGAAKTYNEALQIAAKYTTNPLDREIKLAQLAKLKAEGATEAAKTATTSTPEAIQKSLTQYSVLKNTAQKAIDLSRGAGRSWLHEAAGGLFTGVTEKKQLQGLADQLKVNILTMAADPNIKKFFGPQMSEADVRMMTSAGTTLNPDTQTPAQFKEEASRVLNMFDRAEQAVKKGLPEYKYASEVQPIIDKSGSALQVNPDTYANDVLIINK